MKVQVTKSLYCLESSAKDTELETHARLFQHFNQRDKYLSNCTSVRLKKNVNSNLSVSLHIYIYI